MTIVEVETREAFRARISQRTAMIAALATAERQTMFAPPAPTDWAPAPGPEVMTVREQIEIVGSFRFVGERTVTLKGITGEHRLASVEWRG